MYCYKCGQQLPDGAAFCFRCGAAMGPVRRSVQAERETPVAPPVYPQAHPSGVVPPPTQAPLPAERAAYAPPAQRPPVQPLCTPAPAPATPAASSRPAAPTFSAPSSPVSNSVQSSPPASAPFPAAAPDRALSEDSGVVPQRKTAKMLAVRGIIFLALGLTALGLFGFSVASILMQGGLSAMFPILQAFTDVHLLTSLLSLGYIFALAAGVLIALGGVFSLVFGRGRRPAFTAVVLMLFTLAFDVIYLLLMELGGHLSLSVGSMVMRSLLIYAFEVIFVLVPAVLLILERQAKKPRGQLAPPTARIAPIAPLPPDEHPGNDGPKANPGSPAGMDLPLPPGKGPAPEAPRVASQQPAVFADSQNPR